MVPVRYLRLSQVNFHLEPLALGIGKGNNSEEL